MKSSLMIFKMLREGVLLWTVFLFALPTLADVMLQAPPPPPPMSAEEYPESRFGKKPSQPYVRESAGRSPAGLKFEDLETKKTHSNSVQVQPMYDIPTFSTLIPKGTKGVQEVALIAGDLGFFPKTVFVTRDIPVRMFVTGASTHTLCIMMDSFNVKKQVRTKKIEEITFTPRTPGKYRFYCPVNGMEGTMVVREIASN